MFLGLTHHIHDQLEDVYHRGLIFLQASVGRSLTHDGVQETHLGLLIRDVAPTDG